MTFKNIILDGDKGAVEVDFEFTAREDNPIAYVMVSRPTGAMLWVDATRNNEWDTIERFDNVRKFKEKFYTVYKNKMMTMNRLVSALKKITNN